MNGLKVLPKEKRHYMGAVTVTPLGLEAQLFKDEKSYIFCDRSAM